MLMQYTPGLNVDRQGEGGTLAVNIGDSITRKAFVKVFFEEIWGIHKAR